MVVGGDMEWGVRDGGRWDSEILTGVTDDFQWRRTDGRDRGDGGGLRVKICFCWKNSLAVSVSSFWGRNPVTDKTTQKVLGDDCTWPGLAA